MKKEKQPKVSVILPIYNGAHFMEDAIKSLHRQNYNALEIIIVDDGSTDNTKEIAAKFGNEISYFYQENAGPAKARNLGLSKCSGEFISFIDADDIWPQNKLADQLLLFEKYPNIGVVVGLTLKSAFHSLEDMEHNKLHSKKTFNLLLGCSLMKKSVFDQIGGFDEDLFLGDDTDWFNRVKEERIPIFIQQQIALFYRNHSDNITNDKRKLKFSFFQVLKKAKDRKSKPDFVALPPQPKIETTADLINYWHTAEKQDNE